jgi:hypothetical protein
MSDMPDYVHAVYTSVKNTWQDAENLDDAHGYVSYIWIPEETFKVDVMRLAIFLEKFRTHSKAALSKDLGTKTSVAGGGHSHSVSGATSSATLASHTHDVVIGTKTSTAEAEHKHPITSAAYYPYQTPTDMIPFYELGGNPSFYVAVTRGYGGTPFTYGAPSPHSHDVDYGTKTSAAGGASHTHTVSGQTAYAVTDHTHDVPIGSHDHGINFGIYEEDVTGRSISAALYDPDGNLVKDFGTVLTGEGNDTLDLSGYFEGAKRGMWRLVLSATGRVRVRLVFYELCKMYAQY